jgi:hypothetical protein
MVHGPQFAATCLEPSWVQQQIIDIELGCIWRLTMFLSIIALANLKVGDIRWHGYFCIAAAIAAVLTDRVWWRTHQRQRRNGIAPARVRLYCSCFILTAHSQAVTHLLSVEGLNHCFRQGSGFLLFQPYGTLS